MKTLSYSTLFNHRFYLLEFDTYLAVSQILNANLILFLKDGTLCNYVNDEWRVEKFKDIKKYQKSFGINDNEWNKFHDKVSDKLKNLIIIIFKINHNFNIDESKDMYLAG